MRLVLLLVPAFTFALAFTSVSAVGDSAARRTFDYECQQVDKEKHGFSCDGFKPGGDGPWFTWHRAPRDMQEKERKKAVYEFDKLLFRYLDLGGRNFYVRRADWPRAKHMACMGTGRARYTCQTFCPKEGSPDWTCK